MFELLDSLQIIFWTLAYITICYYGKIIIATFKLLGDLFAWAAYWDKSFFVAVAGAVVLICNVYYLIYSVTQHKKKQK